MKRSFIAVLLAISESTAFAQTSYKDAMEQARAGQPELAIETLRELTNQYPNRSNFRYDYLQVLLWANHDDEVLRQAESLNLNQVPAYVLETIAKAARNLKQFDRATELYRLAASKAHKRLPTLLGIGLVMLDSNKTEAALEYFVQLNQNLPDTPEVLAALGLAEEQANHLTDAEQTFRQTLQLQTNNSEAIAGLIRVQSKLHHYSDAIDFANLHRGSLADQAQAQLRWDYAGWLIRQGEDALDADPNNYTSIDRAIAAIDDNLAMLEQLKLENPQAWRSKAEADLLIALRKRGRQQDLIAHYQLLKTRGIPVTNSAKATVASAYLDLGQFDAAQQLSQEILDNATDNAEALRLQANLYLQTGNKPALDDVLGKLARLADKNPADRQSLYDYLQLLQWRGDNADAVKRAETIDLASAPPYILETIAKAERELHHFERSERLYLLAIQRAPIRRPAKIGLGLLLMDQRRFPDAARHFDALAAQYPNDLEIGFVRAQAHEMAGHSQQASEIYRQLLAEQPNDAKAVSGLINNLTVQGQIARALEVATRFRPAVSDETWASLNWKHAAGLIHQGQQALKHNTDDFRRIDQAIEAIERNLASLEHLHLQEPKVWRSRANGDLLLALRERRQYDLVDNRYRECLDTPIRLPAYALLAVADSYSLSARNPEAIETYNRLLAQDPKNLEAMSGLIRLYLQADRKDAIDPILSRLTQLAEQYPRYPRYRYDQIQTLSWLGRDADVLASAVSIEDLDPPDYVLVAIAHAARNQRDFATAERYYARLAERNPGSLPARLNLARVMLDRQHSTAALEYLRLLRQDYPGNLDIELLQAQAHEMGNDSKSAITHYQNALALNPSYPEAVRGLTNLLVKTDDAPGAVNLANANRTLFNDDEWASLKWGHAAWMIRQGESALARDARNYASTDRAIVAVNQNLASVDSLHLTSPSYWRNLAHFDLMVALRDRRRLNETIALYETLRNQQINPPVYARIAAGDAYLNNRQPEQARDIYLNVLNEVPNHLNSKIALAYAYLEAEQPALALQTAEKLAQDEPEMRIEKTSDGRETQLDNPLKATAGMIAAVFRAYTDDLDGAQLALENLRQRYPDNIDIRNKLAEIYYYRGWPRKAQQAILAAQQQAPGHFGLKLNQARVLHELRDYPEEQRLTHQLYSDYPEDSGTRRQLNAWKRHNKTELKLFASASSSHNQTTKNNDFVASDDVAIDGFLYTPPIGKNFRLFTHDGWRTGAFREGRGYLRHFGTGVEYAEGDVMATAEAHYDNFKSDAIGVDLGLDYRIDDHWQLFSRLSSLDNTISLRALSSGVTGKTARVGTIYQTHESQSFRVAGSYTHYSDENNRFGFDAQYFERWISGPVYKFATYLNAGYSTNQHQLGAYFSPKQDAIASITLDNDWLSYRDYETDFHQRLSLTLGGYWQQDFGVNPVGNLQYEHRWHLGSDVELSYGGGRSYRYYDDALTETWQLFLAADARF